MVNFFNIKSRAGRNAFLTGRRGEKKAPHFLFVPGSKQDLIQF